MVANRITILKDLGRFEEAETLITQLSSEQQLQADVAQATAGLWMAQNKLVEATRLFQHVCKERPRLLLLAQLGCCTERIETHSCALSHAAKRDFVMNQITPTYRKHFNKFWRKWPEQKQQHAAVTLATLRRRTESRAIYLADSFLASAQLQMTDTARTSRSSAQLGSNKAKEKSIPTLARHNP